MPAAPLLPTDDMAPEALAFNAVMALLRTNARLTGPAPSGFAATVVTYDDGEDETEENTKYPDTSDLPYVRALARSVGSVKSTESGHDVTMTVLLQMFTKGLSQTDLFNLAHAVRRVFYPTDPIARDAVDAAFANVGLIGDRITAQASGLGTIGKASHGLHADMTLTVRMYVTTP